MSEKDNGGPAFPNVPDGAGSVWQDWDQGMTLRDYFAAKALGGAMSNAEGLDRIEDAVLFEAAKQCYRMADAMLEARKQ